MKERVNFESMEFKDLSYKTDDGEVILENVNLDIPSHKVVGVAGSTGCGKTTLLKILAGLYLPSEGHYFINGVCADSLGFEEFLPYRMNIGYSFEFGSLISNKTIRDNLMLPLIYHPQYADDECHRRVDELIEIFDISVSKNLRPSEVPGSHRKLAVIARAFVLRPQVLFLDNPTAGLKKIDKDKLIELVKTEMNRDLRHVFIVSEDSYFTKELLNSEIKIVNKDIKIIEPVGKVVGL